MNPLLRDIVSRPWMIDPRVASGYLPQVNKLVNGEPAFGISDEIKRENTEHHAPRVATIHAEGFHIQSAADMMNDEQGVMLMRHHGAIRKHSECGVPGTMDHIESLKAAEADERILAVVFDIDTGGGTVDGTQELSQQIERMSTPVLTYIDGMCCSAGVFIAAASHSIYASADTTEIGSVGVVMAWYNADEFLKKEGFAIRRAYASTSDDKHGAFLKADQDEDYSQLQQYILDPTDKIFMDTVRRNRPGVSEEALTGHVYLSAQAQELGLIDGVATLEEVINEAWDIGLAHSNSNSIAA